MDTITITREQFNDAVRKANNKFRESGKKENIDDDKALVGFMMELQNIVFGGFIADVLFSGE